MSGKFFSALKVIICAVLVFEMVGCGTLMYPKRIGQRGGNIDPAVCILDGLGCLLFIVPGVIAFVVDFANGTIYLPGGRHGSLDMKDTKKVSFDAKTSTMADLEKTVKNETGYNVSLSGSGVRIYAFSSIKEMSAKFAFVSPAVDSVLCSR